MVNKSMNLSQLQFILQNDQWIRVTLSNPASEKAELRTIILRRMKDGSQIVLTNRFAQRDETKNLSADQAQHMLLAIVHTKVYRSIFIRTMDVEYSYQINDKGQERIHTEAITHVVEETHNRQKRRAIAPSAPYLQALGISSTNGQVHARQQDKYRQINHYIELLRPEIDKLHLSERLHVIDMGCGKGYLTFALYDYLSSHMDLPVYVTGVELRQQLVEQTNVIAESCGYQGLTFEAGTIDSYAMTSPDVLIALHACDTATDDAIYAGIESDIPLIVTAPCCHKELRPPLDHLTVDHPDHFIIRHGIFSFRMNEMLTDSIRCMLLEAHGYKVKVIEFIPISHTPKNIMIIARKVRRTSDEMTKKWREIDDVLKRYQIKSQHLYQKLMSGRVGR